MSGSSSTVEDFGNRLVQILPRLRRYALSLCRQATQADDLVQGACERALAARGSWQVGTNFDAWMFRIVRNLWIDLLRHNKSKGIELGGEEADFLAANEADSETRLFVQQVRQAMEKMPEEMREVLFLVCVEGVSYRDAADILDIPVGTVMSRLARARVKLATETGYQGK